MTTGIQKLRGQVRQLRDQVLVRTAHGQSPKGAPLPPLPFRMGGEHFHTDENFVAGAAADVERLVAGAGLSADSRLLDWGCGAGRLAVGVIERFGRIGEYHGVDVQKRLISWAQRHLGDRDGFRFTHVDVANARYNPDGSSEQTIPGSSGGYDVFYAYSVFSHMGSADTSAYLSEVARLLAPGGRAWITAFVEDGVADEEENPAGYGPLTWSGRLHCVRFRREYFESMVADAGLLVLAHEHGRETDGQSLYILQR